jgi:hypothetical protein
MFAGYRAPSARTGCIPQVEKKGNTRRADPGLLQEHNMKFKK